MTSEYLAPTILSSRRLFGPNLFGAAAGAVLDVVCDSDHARLSVQRWIVEARYFVAQLAWPDGHVVTHYSRDSASLFLEAPADGLLTATDLTEQAWVAAEAWVQSAMPHANALGVAATPNPHVTALLQRAYDAERAPLIHVIPMQQFGRAHDLVFSLDDVSCAVGAGAGVYTVLHEHAAHVSETDRDLAARDAHNIPIVLVTGSNGKTTTTRLIAAMARQHGFAVGWNCSDGVTVGHEQIVTGDYTGPGGARLVLGDQRVEFAVLEAARGGMLRRGLAVNRADAAIITNISADHFGEYGVHTLEDLARVKAIVAGALPPTTPLCLNADDPTLRALAPLLVNNTGRSIVWFSRNACASAADCVAKGVAETGNGAMIRDGHLTLYADGQWHDLGAPNDMPITLGGQAVHNVENALAAALTAKIAGINLSAIRTALATFGGTPGDNAGRLMVRHVGAVTVILDYAHNPEGIAALCRTAAAVPGTRRLLLLGQAGDRDDTQLRALAQMAWQTQRFDRVIIKEMESMLRGRARDELPAVLRAALLHAGASSDVITIAPSELHGVREAIAWARAGDVLVLTVHEAREQVIGLLDQLAVQGWRAREP